MRIKKVMCCASMFMLVSAMSLTGQAAEQQEDKSVNSKNATMQSTVESKAPIVVEADKLSFSDLTGDLFADGHVVITQNDDKIMADSMRGNNKRTEFWIDGEATLEQPGTQLTGTGTQYNYTSRIGKMQKAVGTVDKEHISGEKIDFSPDKIVAYDGTVTQCPAKVPDYHISAERVEIWPNDKMIAYNAKFWLGSMVIYSVSKYEVSLKDGASMQNAFPRIRYSNSTGLTVKQRFEAPISNHVAAYADLGYYSRLGFKNQYGIIDREKNYSLDLMQGDYKDDDDNWIKKEPELKFSLHSQRIANLPVSYTFTASYGKWVDNTKSSWHQNYNVYFTHDTINLDKNLFLNMGTGYSITRESYDDSTTNSLRFDTSLTKQWSPKFSTTAEYHYTKNTSSLFSYESDDMAKEGDIGFMYKIDKKNSIGFRERYDIKSDAVYDREYTWYRDLHCWQAAISYKERNHQLHVNVSTTHW